VIDLGTTKICIIHIWLTGETIIDPSPGQRFALYIIHSFLERNKIVLFSTYISTAFNLLFIKTFKDHHGIIAIKHTSHAAAGSAPLLSRREPSSH
jgi:hypothetical protein